jgi:hypothetical protein
MLLNIVKLRYFDTPVFLTVSQIISGYELQGSLDVKGTLNIGNAMGDIVNLGPSGSFTDRPTITYSPLTGVDFLQVLITPIPPWALLRLIIEGWPIDAVLQIGAQSINGLSNRKAGARSYAADFDFYRLLTALRRLQDADALDIRMEALKETDQVRTELVISRKDSSPGIQADTKLVRELLGLRPDQREVPVVYGAASEKAHVISMQTRSGFQIMSHLGSNIEVPPEHAAEQRTYPPMPALSDSLSLPPLIRIHAQKSQPEPADSFVAVNYRDYWYWIDDRDYRSKRVLTFLMIIMTLAEKGEKVQPPTLTIQGN